MTATCWAGLGGAGRGGETKDSAGIAAGFRIRLLLLLLQTRTPITADQSFPLHFFGKSKMIIFNTDGSHVRRGQAHSQAGCNEKE